MVPSSFMISQMTPAGMRPARRARSTEASVWPARTRTPPRRARSGKTWPGRARSCAVDAGVDGDADGVRAVGCRDAGGHAFAGFDGLGKGRAEARGVLLRHGAEAEVVGALFGEGEADEAAAVTGHEVDGLGGDELGGKGEVAFVLAVFIVDDDDHAAGADLFERSGDVSEGGWGLHSSIVRQFGISGERKAGLIFNNLPTRLMTSQEKR